MAQYAERSSVDLHKLLYFKGRVQRDEGYITRVKANGFVVMVPRYGIEGPVFVAEQDAPNPFNYDAGAHTLTYENISFSVFDRVVVEISVDESHSQSAKMKLVCVEPVIPKIEGKIEKNVSKDKQKGKTKHNKKKQKISNKD